MSGAYFLKIKHPSALHGSTVVSHKGRDVSFELINGEAEITAEMGGIDLLDQLVRDEGYKDLSRYPTNRDYPERVTGGTVFAWDLTSPNARDDQKIDGFMAVTLEDGSPKQMAVIQNVVHVTDRYVMDVLTKQEGFKIIKSYERGRDDLKKIFGNYPKRFIPPIPKPAVQTEPEKPDEPRVPVAFAPLPPISASVKDIDAPKEAALIDEDHEVDLSPPPDQKPAKVSGGIRKIG